MTAGCSEDLLSIVASEIRLPGTEPKVFKDECSFSFDTAEYPNGVYICMKYFIAVGPKVINEYVDVTKSNVFLHHRITKKPKNQTNPGDADKIKPTKLALGVPGGFELPQDQYDVSEHWSLVVFPGEHRMDLPHEIDFSTLLPQLKSLGIPDRLAEAISSVMRAESAILAEERARNVAAWEAENVRPVSIYAENLEQLNNNVKIPPTGWKCSQCDLRENLWLNLTDGSINCGRRFWDGSGGNNHAVEHYHRTNFPLAVKLGTITPEGAEVFSYAEDDMVTDPLLSKHLAHFGIDIMRMEKTDKTVAELEISANERLGEWRLMQESDHTLEPRYGPGLTGLRNLGNTCYMNSVIQVLFAIPAFRERYAYRLPQWANSALHDLANTGGSSLPVDHVGLQFAKLGNALCSGEYSWPPRESDEKQTDWLSPPPGIRPLLFRRLMGQRSKTFCSHHQQDACEFFAFLLDLLDSEVTGQNATGTTTNLPSSSFRLSVEDRIECGMTHKVRYTVRDECVLTLPVPMESMLNKAEFNESRSVATGEAPDEAPVRAQVPFEACLSSWCATERVDDFLTPASDPPGAKTFALRQNRLLNFPDYLCVQMAKYTLGPDWLPRKLDCELQFPPPCDSSKRICIDLSHLRSPGGYRPGEEPMPESDSTPTVKSAQFNPDPVIMSQLQTMGFTENACMKACKATGNSGLEAAAGWIMEHLDDPTLNQPLEMHFEPDQGSLDMLTTMGLTTAQAIRALKQNKNDLEAAANWAFANPDLLNASSEQEELNSVTNPKQPRDDHPSLKASLTDGGSKYELVAFISHMGKSTSCGHYVVHIRRSELSRGINANSSPHRDPRPDETDDEWVIFNDEKVAKSESPPFGLAYIYIFRRSDLPQSA